MSGTAELVEDFFPDSIKIARRYLPWLWDRIFPAYGAQLCPKPFIHFKVFDHTLTLGWPVLLFVALLGVAIGWGLGLALLRRPAFKGQFSWGASFLFFGVMNAGAIGYHCFPGRLHLFYVLDVVGTACSSLSMIIGCLAIKGVLNDESSSAQWGLTAIYGSVLVIISVAKSMGTSIICEGFYILPMGVAGIAILRLLFTKNKVYESHDMLIRGSSWGAFLKRGLSSKTILRKGENKEEDVAHVIFAREGSLSTSQLRRKSKVGKGKDKEAKGMKTNVLEDPKGLRNKFWLVMSLGSMVLGSASVSLDRVFCIHRLANWLAVTWIFVACDLAFLFLLAYIW